MAWWIWVVLAIAAVILVMVRNAKRWRASTRRAFIEYLQREAPDVKVVREGEHELELEIAGERGSRINLDRIYAEAIKLSRDPQVRDQLFQRFLGMVREGKSAVTLSAERDHGRVRPRLVNESHLAQLRAQLPDEVMPAVSTPVPGLFIVFVLDSENSVSYLTRRHLNELHLTDDSALALAKENLSRVFDPQIVRKALTGTASVIKTGDTYDAARLLLVPGCLQTGERVAALIPDRDTLFLSAAPSDGDWSVLRKLAKNASGDRLWTEPLVVTSEGLTAVP